MSIAVPVMYQKTPHILLKKIKKIATKKYNNKKEEQQQQKEL